MQNSAKKYISVVLLVCLFLSAISTVSASFVEAFCDEDSELMRTSTQADYIPPIFLESSHNGTSYYGAGSTLPNHQTTLYARSYSFSGGLVASETHYTDHGTPNIHTNPHTHHLGWKWNPDNNRNEWTHLD